MININYEKLEKICATYNSKLCMGCPFEETMELSNLLCIQIYNESKPRQVEAVINDTN